MAVQTSLYSIKASSYESLYLLSIKYLWSQG